MKCPVDSIDLIMSERSGVEIDYCPKCRGVWLDRGELDKIIDRAAESTAAAPAAPLPSPVPVPPPLYNPDPRRDDRRYEEGRYADRRDRAGYEQPRYDQPRYDDRPRPKKKEGWLGDLFDF
ncbi:zf-TFIIB domain-containing protein [Arthrobacter sp. NPDC058192]|uniref:TFIIB-type zinc ribbon-containing protein n=1 Tax=Arthrobacter sp. NPDC058192 TaxID=3346372 RepID=UPI0036EC4354